VSKAFLGLTVNCAKCHDHKYDPIPQADFYRMRAIFEPYHVRLDVRPGEPDLERDGIPCAFDGPADTPTFRFIRGQENQPDKSVVIAPGVPALPGLGELQIQPVPLPIEAWQPERRAWVLETHLAAALAKCQDAQAPIPRLTEALAAALRREADLLVPNSRADAPAPAVSAAATPVTATPPPSRDTARRAVDEARGALENAESALATAQAERVAVEARAEAMRAAWTAELGGNVPLTPAPVAREKMIAAVKAERAAALARARQTLAVARRRWQLGTDDARKAIEKEVTTAREAMEKAAQLAESPVKSDEACAPLAGARWTPTRFLSSGTDDPAVKFIAQSSGRRRALAAWITDRRNPLTARVAVNHIWMRHLGVPLVGTVFDFGRKGTPPTHPELLDWLAAELIESGWSMKHLHELIVTSATYRLSSSQAGGEANAARDPDNLHLWRRSPIRLEAEAVRDSILSLAGTLDPAVSGPPVAPDAQDGSLRRSLYFYHSNNDRNLFLTTFDGAAVKECYRRDRSIVPQQALALTNSRLVHEAAGKIAARLSAGGSGAGSSAADASPGGETAFIRRAFAALLGITASPEEIAASRTALADWRAMENSGDPTNSARAHLIWALVNHNDFVTVR
jgi:hypothetical protein